MLKWQNALHSPHHHRSAQRERWRVLIPWQTTTAAQMPDHGTPYYSTLLGHNGSHTFKVNNMQDSSLLIQNTSNATFSCDELQYGAVSHSYGMWHSVEIDKATDKANVQNLVIENVSGNAGNPDYVFYDSDSILPPNLAEAETYPDLEPEEDDGEDYEPQEDVIVGNIVTENIDPNRRNPKFNFNISDADPKEYRWVVYMRPTTQTYWGTDWMGNYEGVYLMDNASQPGSIVATWNGKQLNNTGKEVEPGTYAFDIGIWKTQNAQNFNFEPEKTIESIFLKSPLHLTMPDVYQDEDGVWQGHSFELKSNGSWRNNDFRAWASYYLDDPDDRNAHSVDIHLIDEKLTVRATYSGGTEDKQPYRDISLLQLQNEESDGGWRAIFMAEDDHAESNRQHIRRRMIALNQQVRVNPQDVKEHIGEIMARKYFIEHANQGWQLLLDPANHNPNGNGPDVIIYRRLATGHYEVGFVDNKAMGYKRRLTLNGWRHDRPNVPQPKCKGLTTKFNNLETGWKKQAEDLIDLDVTDTALRDALKDALQQGRIKKYVTGCGGVAKGVSRTLAGYSVQFIDVQGELERRHPRAYAQLMREAHHISTYYWTTRLAGGAEALNNPVIRADALRIAKKVANAAGKTMKYTQVFLYAFMISQHGVAYTEERVKRDLLWEDETDILRAWGDSNADKIISKLRGLSFNRKLFEASDEIQTWIEEAQ